GKVGIGLGGFPHLGKRRRLQTKIHFHHHRAAQGVDDLDQAQPSRLGGGVFGVLGGKGERGEIGVKATFDAGAQNLYGDSASAGRGGYRGPMHLRNRGGGNRGAEICKNHADRLVERRGDRRLSFRLRKWRQSVPPTPPIRPPP